MQNRELNEKIGFYLILIMGIIQLVYAGIAFFDQELFARIRGTHLFNTKDADWVVIYASRTLFIAMLIGLLLIKKHYSLLKWLALLGLVMPITDLVLAYNSKQGFSVICKHVTTSVYLIITYFVLNKLSKSKNELKV